MRYFGVTHDYVLNMPYATYLALGVYKTEQRELENKSMESELMKLENPRGR